MRGLPGPVGQPLIQKALTATALLRAVREHLSAPAPARAGVPGAG